MRNNSVIFLDSLDVLKLRNQYLFGRRAEQTNNLQIFSENSGYSGGTIVGLSYPIRYNGAGGLSLSYNSDRIKEQIIEVIQTRIGERIYRQFFGLPDLIFESLSEEILSNLINKQLKDSLALDVNALVKILTDESGSVIINITYQLNGVIQDTIKFSLT